MPKKADFDIEKLKAIMRMKPTLEDVAAFFQCEPRTIQRFIRQQFKCTFVVFREQNMVHTRLSLVRTAIQQAEKGNTTMLIFCLKNLCGWGDRLYPADAKDLVPISSEPPKPPMTEEQLVRIIDIARKKA